MNYVYLRLDPRMQSIGQGKTQSDDPTSSHNVPQLTVVLSNANPNVTDFESLTPETITGLQVGSPEISHGVANDVTCSALGKSPETRYDCSPHQP